MTAARVLMTARWVVGHEDGRHVLLEDGEVVFEGGRIVFVGHHFPGEMGQRAAKALTSWFDEHLAAETVAEQTAAKPTATN